MSVDPDGLWAEMAEVARSAGPVEQRAQAMLGPLLGAAPAAAGWIAVRDPETRRHRPVGSRGDTGPLVRYFGLPEADDELERFGMNRSRPPMRAGDVPVPLPETLAWGEYLLPAGYRDGIAVGLFAEDGRHLGFLSLLSDDPSWPTSDVIGVLDLLRPLLARALDRLPSLTAAAALAGDVLGAAVLTRGGGCLPVPDLPPHPLLVAGSRPVEVARGHLGAPGAHASFLCPFRTGLVRVTVLDCRDDGGDHLAGLVLVRPAGDLGGLGPAELRVLGALVAGRPAEELAAVVPRVGAAVGRVADRLGLPSDGLAVHAARRGLHVPPALWR